MSDKSSVTSSESGLFQQGTDRQIQGPYEAALNKAFDKLNSQILIFLLAYLILVIGLTLLHGDIPDSIVSLLYMVPLLAIIAYGWSRKRTIVQDPNATGINVQALRVSGQAYVAGRLGKQAHAIENDRINVNVGLVSDRARVVGEVLQAGDSGRPDEATISDIYSTLDPALQREALRFLISLVDRQEATK